MHSALFLHKILYQFVRNASYKTFPPNGSDFHCAATMSISDWRRNSLQVASSGSCDPGKRLDSEQLRSDDPSDVSKISHQFLEQAINGKAKL
jgi:hypothetical protein